ncbi:hypothetical protein GIB67_038182, partial [Kingdonia uniflora]
SLIAIFLLISLPTLHLSKQSKVYCLSVENHSCSRLFDSKFKVCLGLIWVLLDFCFCGSFHLDIMFVKMGFGVTQTLYLFVVVL